MVQDQTRVFIFESTPMASELLSNVLERSQYGIRIVGTATSAGKTDLATAAEANVALISARLHEGPRAGFSVLRRLAPAATPACVMLLDRAEEDTLVEAFASGALGVCDRSQSYDLLCKCVRCVHQGQVWANSGQLRTVLAALVQRTAGRRLLEERSDTALSSREMAIVSLVAEGRRNREIASSLAISQHTVKNHLFNIFEKLGVSTRAELILYFAGQKQGQAASKA